MSAQVLGPRPLALGVGQTGGYDSRQRVPGVDEVDVGLATLSVWHCHLHGHPVAWGLHPPPRRSRVREFTGEDLQCQHAEGEGVQLRREGGRVAEGLRGHVDCGRPAHLGETGRRKGSSLVVAPSDQLGHPDISDFGLEIGAEEYVIAGEVAMDDVVRMQVREG